MESSPPEGPGVPRASLDVDTARDMEGRTGAGVAAGVRKGPAPAEAAVEGATPLVAATGAAGAARGVGVVAAAGAAAGAGAAWRF